MWDKPVQPPKGPPPGYAARDERHQNTGRPHVTFGPDQPQQTYSSEISEKKHSLNPFRRAHSPRQDQHQYSSAEKSSNDAYIPPPGPPPSQAKEQIAPPPGPPPSRSHHHQVPDDEPPPYDPWLQVPDNATLPPPPSFGSFANDESPTANASADSADRARHWCRLNKLYSPRRLTQPELISIQNGALTLTRPPNLAATLSAQRIGTTLVRTRPSCDDSILLSHLPLYTVAHHSPIHTGRGHMIYFEILVKRMGGSSSHFSTSEADAGIAIGFLAPPYPSFRLPGWERASLGIHGDDGRRYVDNNRGGQDFTTSFRAGEVVGIGMMFSPPSYQGDRVGVEVFFTREGKKEGGWNLYEERDADEEGSVDGLDGTRDLLAAVGFFGGVEFETRFRRDEWLYMP